MKLVRESLCMLALAALTAAAPGQEPTRQVPAPENPRAVLPAENPRTAMPVAEEPRAAAPAPAPGPIVVRGSLYQAAAIRSAMPVPEGGKAHVVSYIHVEAPEPKKWKKNDQVTVIVREDSNTSSTGSDETKRTQDFDLALKQFMAFGNSGSQLMPLTNTPTPGKLPEVAFKYNNDAKADASKTRTDSISWRIEAKVVDVKPNGTLVIEATKRIKVDKEEQTFRLTGICKSENVTIDNTILSTQLADLNVEKTTAGDVKKGTDKKWGNKLLDIIMPF